ncbi:MAG: acetyltransferase [Acidobacteria bacterium]|nr:acetyltransferase [Acidobacteriota bacterium]
MEKQNGKQKLMILGAGLFAEEIAEVVAVSDTYELSGFVEGVDPERCRQTLNGLPIIWIEDVGRFVNDHQAICAVGTPKRENFIRQAKKQGLPFTSIVHPSANVLRAVSIGEGTIVHAGVIIGTKTSIGCHTIVNRGCLIGHHVAIGDYVTISPGANIAGKVKIADSCYIGMGAVLVDGISVGCNAVVGAGAVVTRDVPDRVQVVGVPARIVKELG